MSENSTAPVARSRRVRRVLALRATALVLLWTAADAAVVAARPPLEYQVKAAYVFNFLQFVDWPAGVLSNGSLAVCLFGEDRFGAAIDAIEGQTVRGNTVRVRRVTTPDQLDDCRAVYIPASARRQDVRLLQRLANQPVLTIGETPGFTERGGVINLVQVQDKIRFEINKSAAERAGLKVSSQLLQLALPK